MRFHASVILGSFLVGAVGCGLLPTREHEGFCCLGADSCAAVGASITPCNDPDRPFCTDDESGELGARYTCVADPYATPCDEPSDCSEERPFCVDDVCVQCEDDGDCPLSAPVCGAETRMCTACLGDDDCADRPDATRCLVEEGACIQCLGAEECGGDTPVCDDHVCRPCRAHDECASDACDVESGACFDEDDVIYLEEGGATSGTCTRANPCATFALGLAVVSASRQTIRAAEGTYRGPIAIDGETVTILADGAVAQPGAIDSVLLDISGDADVTIDGLVMDGISGPATGRGVVCETSTLRLRRSTVSRFVGGGVTLSGCAFSLVNNVVVLNGGISSPFGGVRIADVTTPGLAEFAFNTVAYNDGATDVITGVQCNVITPPISLTDSIVYGNEVAGEGAQVGGDSSCTWTFSNIQDGPAGDGNIDADPQFVDIGSRDFHLMPLSPSQNVADPEATLARDIDGDIRPQGGRADMGADEVLE
jgi:hypothetical protein